jgi:hypothetical protein
MIYIYEPENEIYVIDTLIIVAENNFSCHIIFYLRKKKHQIQFFCKTIRKKRLFTGYVYDTERMTLTPNNSIISSFFYTGRIQQMNKLNHHHQHENLFVIEFDRRIFIDSTGYNNE